MLLHKEVMQKVEFTNRLKEELRGLSYKDVIFVCIGTDKVSGDSFGTFVGSYLKEYGFTNVVGDLEETVNNQNIRDIIKELPRNKKIIAIDATLGNLKDRGKLLVSKGSVVAGASV